MRRLLITVLVCLLHSAETRAEASAYTILDEINGTKMFRVILPSDDYQKYTRENYFVFTCELDGNINIGWHRGGRHSGWFWNWWYEENRSVYWKIDDGPVNEVEGGPDAETVPFINALIRGNRLIAKLDWDQVTTSFSLRGTAKAFSTFKGQCM